MNRPGERRSYAIVDANGALIDLVERANDLSIAGAANAMCWADAPNLASPPVLPVNVYACERGLIFGFVGTPDEDCFVDANIAPDYSRALVNPSFTRVNEETDQSAMRGG